MTLLDARSSNPLEGGSSFSIRHRVHRLIWNICWSLLAAWTPNFMFRWRAFVLSLFGAKIHPMARVYGSARIWYPPNLQISAHAVIGPRSTIYCQGKIYIGEKTIISQGAHLCAGTHDIASPHFQLIVKPIYIEDRAWVAAEAFIGPGVTVGMHAVIGARSVLFKNAIPYGVYIGNPAFLHKQRIYCTIESDETPHIRP